MNWHKIWIEVQLGDGETETVPLMGKTAQTAHMNAAHYVHTYRPGCEYKIIKEDTLLGKKHVKQR